MTLGMLVLSAVCGLAVWGGHLIEKWWHNRCVVGQHKWRPKAVWYQRGSMSHREDEQWRVYQHCEKCGAPREFTLLRVRDVGKYILLASPGITLEMVETYLSRCRISTQLSLEDWLEQYRREQGTNEASPRP